jgi:phage terminase large subunit
MKVKDIYVNGKLYGFLQEPDIKTFMLYGGAGAGKSYTVAQHLAQKFVFEKNKHFLVSRKTNPALRISAYQLMLHILDEFGIKYEHNKSEQVVSYGKNKIFFKSLDDSEKIKSSEFNYAWLEETTEFSFEDYLQVKLRLRRRTNSTNQLFLTFNPVDIPWLREEMKNSNVAVMKVTYKDNPALNKEYIETIERLKEEDETYYKIYALGEFAAVKGLIYTNWQITDNIPEGDTFFGLDFGFNHPTALVKVIARDDEFYVQETIYQSGLTNSDLINKMKELSDIKDYPIYCDAAEPNRIEELARAGFNVWKADKKSVRDGIDFIKAHKLWVEKNSVNVINEIRTYKWQEKKNGIIIDEPVKFNDDAMDAMRYAIYTHSKKTGMIKSVKIDI